MAPAILRETSGGTSYQIARLVFRPYGQLRRTICTSVPLRTSTRVSPGLVLAVRSSRSFGSQRARSCSNLSKKSRSADSAEPKKPITDSLFLLLPCSLSEDWEPRFHYVSGASPPSTLARASDSLVRVSRRVTQGRSADIANALEVRKQSTQETPMIEKAPVPGPLSIRCSGMVSLCLRVAPKACVLRGYLSPTDDQKPDMQPHSKSYPLPRFSQ